MKTKLELLKIKEDIELQLKEVELQIKYIDELKTEFSKEKNKLSDLNKNDKIFCIHFNGSKIYHMDYVKISFNKSDNPIYEKYTSFSTSHDTKSIGCSSSITDDCMDTHCFLSEFCSNSMYFFTLKPESWKVDLKLEIERLVKIRKKNFNKDIKKFKNNVNEFVKNKNEVDKLLLIIK